MTPTPPNPTPPNPSLVLETLTAFRRSAALSAAIELGVFSALGQAADDDVEASGGRRGKSASVLARSLSLSEQGVRSLCDYLVVLGFLTFSGGRYDLTAVSARYLDSASDAYLGAASRFLNAEFMQRCFAGSAAAVRAGRSAVDSGTMGPEHPIWVEFARGMSPMIGPTAVAVAELLAGRGETPERVLDVAAGHGLYGIELARRFDKAQVVALDWENVLAVAREQAAAAGVERRISWLNGSAFDVDLGGPYDLVLLPAFLHHFDPETCVALLRRIGSALAPGGLVVTVETVSSEADERSNTVSSETAAFGFVMLVTTPGGTVYRRQEWTQIFLDAGFGASEFVDLTGSDQTAILTRKPES